MSKSIVIGVDVGGTFTDTLALDEATGAVRVEKVPSTKGDQSNGFLSGILAATDHDLSSVSRLLSSCSFKLKKPFAFKSC